VSAFRIEIDHKKDASFLKRGQAYLNEIQNIPIEKPGLHFPEEILLNLAGHIIVDMNDPL